MRFLTFFFVFLLISAFAGCGEPVVKFGGTVKYSDGSPVTHGAVNFDSGQFTFVGVIDAQGNYTPGMQSKGAGIPEGKYRIWLTGTEKNTDTIKPDGTLVPGRPLPLVAPKFCNVATSGLEFEVKSGGPKIFDIVVERP